MKNAQAAHQSLPLRTLCDILGWGGGSNRSFLAVQSINCAAIVPVGRQRDGEQRSGVKIILPRSIKDKEPRPPLNDPSWH